MRIPFAGESENKNPGGSEKNKKLRAKNDYE